MANHKDAAKRATQSVKRRTRNCANRTRMRNSIADLRTKIEVGEAEPVQSSLRSAISVIQRLATKGVIHRNQAARRVARLTLAANKAKPAPVETPKVKGPAKKAAAKKKK